MARYVDDYRGIIGHDVPGRGMDPNYRGGYEGMRMRGGPSQAEYGWYRALHPGDFAGAGGSGGFGPRRGPLGLPPAEARMGPTRGPQGPHGWGEGGVRNSRYDRELLHDFNANSPALARERGRYDLEQRRPLPRGVSPWRTANRPGYSNRGMSDAGYSEGWAWGPMRGAR